MKPDAILIAGPTASGKSALALRLAQRWNGVVVNADALQVYDGLRILTARPRSDEMAGVPHHLYGHIPPDRAYSAGEWRREAERLVASLPREVTPVFCGGTGLYFRALMSGFDDMPVVPDAIRSAWRERSERESAAVLHDMLKQRDETAASRIRPSDRQRIVRALELIETTGRPLAELQRSDSVGVFAAERVRAIVLTPPRDGLRERIAQRFHAMIAEGAREEAERFAARYGTGAPLAEKAIGVREFLDVAEGRTTIPQAADRAITRSRQYAKRQETWFRNQFGPEWTRYASPLDVPDT